MKKLFAALFACFTLSANASLIPVDLSGGVAYNGQFTSGTFTPSNSGSVLTMQGDNWIAFKGPFEINADTVIEIMFSSSNVREIHGFGFDDDLNFSFNQQTNRVFQLAGTQRNFGIQDFNTYTGGGVSQSFSIPVGQYFTGTFNYFLLINDDDNTSNASSVFGANISANAVNAPSHVALFALGLMGLSLHACRRRKAK